jgi:hypothetical protein
MKNRRWFANFGLILRKVLLNLSMEMERIDKPGLAKNIYKYEGPLTDIVLGMISNSDKAIDFMKKKLNQFYKDYISYLKRLSECVGDEVFTIVARYLKVNIFLLDTTNKYIYRSSIFSEDYPRAVVIGYDGGHYEPMVAEINGNSILAFSNEDNLIKWFRYNTG